LKAESKPLAHQTYALLLKERSSTAMLIAACSVILSWVALLNNFPLVFPDTLSYATTAILGEIPGMFSAYYSLFILPLHQGVTLWPVVFVQGAIVSYSVYLVVRCASGGKIGKLATLLIVGALSLLSSLPWVAGQLMPDVFTPVVFLGLFLLAFCTHQLARTELVYVVALTAAAIATHLSHVPIALGLIVLCVALRLMFAITQIAPRRLAALLLLPFVVAVCAMLAVNWINSRTIAFARNSNVFLLAKWIEEGPAMAYLTQACPDARYSLCPYLDNLRGAYQDDLKWWGGSPFYKVGGLDQLEPEAREIVWATLGAYPFDIFKIAMTNWGRQLLRFDIGEGLDSGSVKLVAPYIGEVFGPDTESTLRRSQQADDRLPIAAFRQLHLLALPACLVLGLWSLIAGRRRMPIALAVLYVYVSMGILWSALVTGALSGPFERYLARVFWLLYLVPLVGSCYIATLRWRAIPKVAKRDTWVSAKILQKF
jgi:hypothetical protein